MSRLVGPFPFLLCAAALAATPSHAAPPAVSIHDAHVVEGNSGTSELRFAIEGNGPPRRVQLDYSVSDLSASAAGGDYSPVAGSLSLIPAPPELVGHLGTGLFASLAGIALAPNGDVLGVESGNSLIHRFSRTGALLQTFGHVDVPMTIAVNSFGEIYVANFHQTIERFSPSGVFLNSWGQRGTQPSQFASTWGMAFDDLGVLYVCDLENDRVQKFDRNGAFLGLWSTASPGEPPYDGPQSIAIDHAGNVYIGKPQSGQIAKYSNTGTLLDTWTDTRGRCIPNSLAIDDAGNLLIADDGASRIVVLDSQGEYLSEWFVEDGPNVQGTRGIATDGLGNVFVSSRASNSIAHYRWDRSTGTLAVPVVGDGSFESNETLQVELMNPLNATLQDAIAIGTIVNDDPDLGVNQASNGGFDSGFTGWSAFQGSFLAITGAGTGGSNAASVTGPSAVATFGLNDSPDIISATIAGARYRYTAWVRSGTGGHARLRVREYLAGVLQSTAQTSPIAFDGEWQRLEIATTAHAAGSTLDFQVLDDPIAPGEVFLVDDVAVHPLGVDVSPVLDVVATAAGSWLRDIVVQVSAHDPEGEAIESLDAELTAIPGAEFTVSSDHKHGTLRWRPRLSHIRNDPYVVTFSAGIGATSVAETRIAVGANVVLNSSFDSDLTGWATHNGSTLERISGGRHGSGSVARLTLPVTGQWAGINDSPDWTSPSGQRETYIIGFWVRSQDSAGDVRLQVREYQGSSLLNAATFSSPPFVGEPQLSPAWHRVSFPYTSVTSGSSHLDLTIDANGQSGQTFEVDDVSIISTGTSPTVDVPELGVVGLAARVFPNPARGPSVLELSVPASGRLRVELFDLAGRRVSVAADEAHAEAGVRRLSLDGGTGSRLGPGVYWYRASTPQGTREGRFVILE